MAERNLNLKLTPADEALFKYFSALEELLIPKFEIIPIEDSLDRVTSVPVCAKLNSPHYNAAAMDGITVKTADFNGGSITDYINVNTGDPVCAPYDAVIMAEDLIFDKDRKKIKTTKSVSPGQHIRLIGESIKEGEEILSAKHKIRPVDIGMLLTAGITTIEVYTIPKVAIFPTGSEIIDICASNLQTGEAPEAGKIIESNSRMYEAQVKQAGGEGVRFNPVPDNFDLLKNAVIKAAAEFDIVLINAGSSAGTEDFTVQVLREIGEVIIHGVAMKPGKPVILAKVNNKPVIGTPGYPVSAYISFNTFVSPVLSCLNGNTIKPARRVEAVISEKINSVLKQREYIRVKLETKDGKLTAIPLTRHSGVALSLVKADGFCVIEQGIDCIEAGSTVMIELIDNLNF